MKRKLICLLIAISLVTASALFAGGKKEDVGGKKIVKLGHVMPLTSFQQYVATTFEEELEKTAPNIDIQVFPSGQLGGTLEMMQGLQTGAVGVYLEFGYIWEGIVPEFKALCVHYAFKDNDSYINFINSDIFENWNDKLAEKAGVRITGSAYGGCEFNFLSKKPINSIEDVKGMKNRCAQMAPLLESWRAYGANPTPLDWGEIYTSLATGVIEGLDNPISDLYTEKFYEIAKYYNMTGNLQTALDFNTSDKLWNSLTLEEQTAWENAIKVASDKAKIMVNEETKIMIANMEEAGITVIYPDKTPFIKSINDNIDKVLNNNKDAIVAYKEIKAAGY